MGFSPRKSTYNIFLSILLAKGEQNREKQNVITLSSGLKPATPSHKAHPEEYVDTPLVHSRAFHESTIAILARNVVEPTPASDILQAPRTPRSAFRTAFVRAGATLEEHPYSGLALVLGIYLVAALGYSLSSPLWHDELFTFEISRAPSLHDLLYETRTIDLNPPLSYLLTRATFYVFGVGTLQARLPNIAGLLLAMTCVFAFVRRRTGAAFGLLAAAFLMASQAGEYAIDARPYGLMLGWIALAFAAWQASVGATDAKQPNRAMRCNLLLFVALACLLLTHVLGVLALAVLGTAELTNVVLKRRFNVGRAVAFVLPLALIWVYRPLLENHAHSSYPAAFQPVPLSFLIFYIERVMREVPCVLLAALGVALFASPSWMGGSSKWPLTAPESVGIASLIAMPALLIARLMLQHAAFFDRYGIAASVGVAVFAAAFFCWWSGGRAAAALLALIIAVLITGRLQDAVAAIAAGHIFRHTEPTIIASHLDSLPDPALPLVDASGLTFLEMNYREAPPLLARTYYLTGGPIAIQYANATIFEGMGLEKTMFHLPANVEAYGDFVREHPHFYVFGTLNYPEDWLLRKLQADGARLSLQTHVAANYKDHDVYEVAMPPAVASH